MQLILSLNPRLYLDAFAANNPLGSSSNKHKVMGFYYSAFVTHEFGAQRSTIQTVALILQKAKSFHIMLAIHNICIKSTVSYQYLDSIITTQCRLLKFNFVVLLITVNIHIHPFLIDIHICAVQS